MQGYLYSQTEIILIIALSFLLGVGVGSLISFIYWRKRVVSVKSKQKTSFLKIYFILIISLVWLIATMSEAIFKGPPVNVILHVIMGGVTGVVLGPDFARFVSSVRIGIGTSNNSTKDTTDNVAKDFNRK